MPLVAHNALPTFDRLRRDGITVLSTERAANQEIRELHVGLLNMMPDAALEATERQFYRLVGESNPIAQFYMHPFTLPALPRGAAAQAHIAQFYESFDAIREKGLDALIITGANVSHPNLADEAFWQPLIEVIDWAWDHVTSTLCSCLATHAVMQFRHGQTRVKQPRKIWGVFEHRVTDGLHPLIADVNTRFDVPHSRWNNVSRAQFEAAGVKVLVESAEAGVHLAVSGDGLRTVFFQGHPEYDTVSLLKEYKRDLLLAMAGKLPALPHFPVRYFNQQAQALLLEYQTRMQAGETLDFPESLLLPLLDNTWHDTAEGVIGNWIGCVYQVTHRERGLPFMPGIDPNNPLGLDVTAARAHFDETQGALVASGDWHADAASALPRLEGKTIRILDGAAITQLDTNGAWLLLNAARPQPSDPMPELRDFQPRHLSLMNLVAEHAATTAAQIELPHPGLLAAIGRGSFAMWRHFSGLVNFIGQLTIELARLMGKPENWRWRELGAQVSTVFAGAIPIVIGMMFLLGVVFAYLLGDQALQYGASIFVVDGLLLAILREISPVIVAVLIAGRSGAAITAQLGTMKVTEEIDAITTLGLSPLAVLVIPRMIALLIALPLLIFIGDIAGIIGGMLVAQAQLDISPHLFMDRVDSVLRLKTLLVGILKGPIFAIFIALIACRMGLSVSRDASSVGANTTSTVVQSLVAIIVLNAIFAVMFVRMGI